jgi:hypothetical protein
MTRRSRGGLGALLVVAAALAALAFAPAAPAASGGGCQLKGTASFSPGLNITSQPFTYSFAGDLTGCQSSEAGSPATGRVQAGGTYTDPGSGKSYVMPSSTGTGSCGSSTTQGLALITWADGSRTIIQYTTSGAAAAVALQGTVADSTTLQPVDPLDTPLTVTTVRGLQPIRRARVRGDADRLPDRRERRRNRGRGRPRQAVGLPSGFPAR